MTVIDEMCNPANGVLEGCTLRQRLEDTKYLTEHVLKVEGLVYIVLVFVFLYLARWTYNIKLVVFHGKKLNFTLKTGFADQLTKRDNKALAVSFAAYMFAVGLILWSSMSELDSDLGKNVVLILWWQFVGMLLLEVARLVNDKLLLSAWNIRHEGLREAGFDNNVELVNHANLAVGFAEAGSYIASGMVIMGTVSGPPGVWWQDCVNVVVFFTLGQIAFLLFAALVNTKLISSFNFFYEIKKQNVAAGVLFALELLAIGNLVSNSILKSDSVVTFGVWFGLGGLALVVLRFLVDYVIIPQEAVDKEIQRDRNVGAALLVGGIPLGLSFVINTFLPDTCLNNT